MLRKPFLELRVKQIKEMRFRCGERGGQNGEILASLSTAQKGEGRVKVDF